jgi:glyoxylase-like metal-dependent hydrolase (beta-lactamase superfamily II)
MATHDCADGITSDSRAPKAGIAHTFAVERTITSVLGNSQRLDGGAMFGNAPKALWSRWATPDGDNRIPLACRCMLVREDDRLLLFEAGIGAFFEPRLADRYGVVEREHVLLRSLEAVGVRHTDVDLVVLSHLHFDHAGGLLTPYREGQTPELLFPRATFLVSSRAWERAQAPHPRDQASFVPELNHLLATCGRLELVEGTTSPTLGPGYHLHYSDGHTPGLMLTEVDMPGGPVLYAGDLVPGAAWAHLPLTMGYDRYPELLVDEKRALFDALLPRNGRLFFTHDPDVAVARLSQDDRGRFQAVEPLHEVRDMPH